VLPVTPPARIVIEAEAVAKLRYVGKSALDKITD
jgi:hypothetical protein